MRALVADDDRVTAEILSRTLKRWEFDVTVVGNGAAAWDHLRAATAPTLAFLQLLPAVEAATDARRARSQRRWTISKRRSSARKRKSWNRRAWPELATCTSSKLCVRGQKLDATIRALAGAGRNIRSVAGQIRKSLTPLLSPANFHELSSRAKRGICILPRTADPSLRSG